MLLDRIINKHGVEAVAYGVPGLTANSLIRAASRYVPIEGLSFTVKPRLRRICWNCCCLLSPRSMA